MVSYSEELDYLKDTQDIQLIVMNLETKKIILETLNNLKPIYKYVLILKYIDYYNVIVVSDTMEHYLRIWGRNM